MKKKFLSLAMFLILNLMFGCRKPDSVIMNKSPTEGVFYTVEISKGVGLASDTTRVYAHLERHRESRKTLVLEGDDLTVDKIIWNNPHDATLCLDGGFTNIFLNQVTLDVDDGPADSETIYNHLREHCDSRSTTSSNATN
jgi:hypothetical protein